MPVPEPLLKAAFTAAIIAALISWACAAFFMIAHQARFGPYWKPSVPASGRLIRRGLMCGGLFVLLLVIAFAVIRPQLYGPLEFLT